MTKLLILRHGHVAGIAPLRFRGRQELPLSPLGRRQAEALAREVEKRFRLDSVYTSPLERCRQTARALGRPFALEAQASDAFIDIDYGAWQGLSLEEARGRWPTEVDLWLDRPHLARIPGGETLAALFARCADGLESILRLHASGTIALVAHESVNRALLLYALELPLSRYWRLGQEPAAINELEYEGGSFSLRSLNETRHLAGLS